MMEILVAAGLFWCGFFIGKVFGENGGYDKGWRDKENGQPYKRPNK